jgi:amidophosphoribosyltransferase
VCGLIAIYSRSHSAQKTYQGLLQLQHRGQDAAGIVTLEDQLSIKKGLGRVEDIAHSQLFVDCPALFSMGHTRYATSGGSSPQDVQPFSHDAYPQVALAHNGHLPQAPWMDPFREQAQSTVDSNLLLHFLVGLLKKNQSTTKDTTFFSLLCQTVTAVFKDVPGAYSVVSLIAGKGLLVFRDPQGIRPLIMGERINSLGKKDYIFASESYLFKELDFQLVGEVPPGEVLFVNYKGDLYQQSLIKNKKTPCSFEYVYFAKAKSTIEGIQVEDSRRRMGHLLAQRWQASYSHLKPDFVLPIPNTANTAALAFAEKMGFNYHEYFEVNAKAGRTFIHADPLQREGTIDNKLSIHEDKVNNKSILLFDDSIVRGVTAAHLVKKLKSQGAKHIYFVCACPPVVNVCFYGINIPTKAELIAAKYSQEEIKRLLAVDELLYPEPQDLVNTIGFKKNSNTQPCIQCMQR